MPTTLQPLDRRINYRFNQISHRWSSLVVSMARKKYKLNPAEMKMLSVIGCYQPVSPSDLVDRTSSDSPKVARVVTRLVEEGLIEREQDSADGRRAVLTVTKRGAAINQELDRLSHEVEERVTSVLTADDRKHLEAILDKLDFGVHAVTKDIAGSRSA
ncbi:MarR family winged helix-turn-helix transcriptional regulator [Ottowia thiooxydans]|uniref:DNA-binding MarR family transcriptional regulator n=1 Tax=Ottowia thiooxydans TaxID=219182 RepID=A0ABV2QG06_9BURK